MSYIRRTGEQQGGSLHPSRSQHAGLAARKYRRVVKSDGIVEYGRERRHRLGGDGPARHRDAACGAADSFEPRHRRHCHGRISEGLESSARV